MVPEKRKLKVVGIAIAAAFAVTGCAPAGYNQAADYGDATEPAAENVAASPGATADPNATTDPNAEADPDATAPPGSENAVEVSEDEVTTKLTASSVKRMGKVVLDDDGFVLYRFDSDENKPAKSNCNDDCEKVWPAALTNSGEVSVKGVDNDLVGTVTRADGTKQLTLDGWPLYRYIGDKKPGQWKGQNVGGKWFVILPTGKKNLTCLPPVSKAVAPPADDSEEGAADDGGDGGDFSY